MGGETYKRLQDVASITELTNSQLKSVLEEIDRETYVLDYADLAYSEDEPDVAFVYRNPPTDYVLKVSDTEWASIIERAELDDKEAEAAKMWHAARGEDLVQFKDTVEDLDSDETYLIIRFPIVERWNWVKPEMALWFKHLAEMELTPAEILDYWMVEQQAHSPSDWAQSRQVTPEAVRKNVRQAAEKVGDSPVKAQR